MKRATLAVFVLLLVLTGVFCLAACNDGAETHTHTLVHRDAVAATCTSPGNEQYWECSECGKLFSDEAGTTEIASAVTAPLGHDFADGVCTRCGEKDYDTQIGPLTRAEFEKALDIAALPNFTVTDKDPDGTVNYLYKFVTTEEYDVAYYSEPGAGEDYFFLQDKSTGVTTQYAYDRDESKWTSEPTKKTVASIKTGFVYADNSSLSMDVAGAYPTATFDGTKYILPDCYHYHTLDWDLDVEVTFDSDKRLASLRTVIGDFSTPYCFSDYGTTEIVLPDFEAQATWGFVFSEDDLGLVEAYFNPDDPICGAYAPDRIYVPAEWNGKPVSVVNISSVYDSTYISLKGLDALERLVINYATSLDTLELPLITEEIFPYLYGVDALKTVTYPGTKAQWTAAGLDDDFDGYRGLTVEFGTHTFGEWQTESEADCENAGLMTRQCSDCGKVEEQIIPAKGHSFGDWQTVTPVTCTADGLDERVCQACGTKAQWTAAGLDDDFDGYRGLTVEFGTHTFGEWQTESEADCENAGLMTRQCSDCGKVEEQIIPAKGHSFGDWQTVTPVTCTADGLDERVCQACGYKEERTVTASGHAFGEWTVLSAATCVDDGEESRTCSVCGTEEKRVIPATGIHSYSEEWITSPETHWHECTVCGATADKSAHELADGNECSVCGYMRMEFTLKGNGTLYMLTKVNFTAERIEIPATYKGLPVTSIGDSVFEGHAELVTIVIPEGIVKIGKRAFADCTGLTGLALPDSVRTIDDRAFINCSSITELDLVGINNLGEYVFARCASLHTVHVDIYGWLMGTFSGCSALKNVTIEQGNLIGIHEGTFTGCYELKEITFNGTKAEWLKLSVEGYWTDHYIIVNCTDASFVVN